MASGEQFCHPAAAMDGRIFIISRSFCRESAEWPPIFTIPAVAWVLLFFQGMIAEACRMLEFGLLGDFSAGGFTISPEAILYVLVVTLYAFIGSPRSCLINTFAFTFYWGFIFLMSKIVEAGMDGNLMLVYVVSGAGLFVLVNIASFREGRKNRNTFEQASALPAGQS